MKLSLIVAVAENDVIGRDGDLPWSLSDDLQRFKQLTTGHAIIMGRRTYDSIGRPLPNRTNIVVTRQTDLDIPGVTVCHTLQEALIAARSEGDTPDDEVFIIGGESLYREAFGDAACIHLTRVHAMIEGDTRFPRLDDHWTLTAHEHRPADERHAYPRSFQTWERISRPPSPNGS